MRIIACFVPVVLTFGPFFMVLGLRSASLSQYSIALGGALALAVGLAVLFRRLSHQQQRLAELEGELGRLRATSL